MRNLLLIGIAFSLLISLALSSSNAQNKNGEWPQWRGPQSDAVCIETGLLPEWPKGGPPVVWDSKKVNKDPSVGTGVSSLAITKGRIYTMGDLVAPESKGKKVFVSCLDADSGKLLWKTLIGPASVGGPGGGTRCTPTVDGDRVYALTTQGLLVCLKNADGSKVWEKDLVKEFGGRPPGFGGYSESPYIDGEKLVCTPGGKKARMVALNKLTGDTYWTCETQINDGTGFASIVKTEVGGVKVYLTLGHKALGLFGVDAETGKFLFSYNKIANGTANIPTPIVKGEYVFASTAYNEGGAALVKLVSTGKGEVKVEEQYHLEPSVLQNHHGGMVMVGDYIYGGHGHNNGLPFCLEWKTGKLAWGPLRGPGERSAAVLYADGNLYVRYENGVMALIEASPKGYNVKGSFSPATSGSSWPHPVIYHGRLYLRGDHQIVCYDIRQK